MSNLSSAKNAVKAELAHARQGAAFYQSRIDSLEEALAKLDSVDVPSQKSRSAPGAATKKAGRKAMPAGKAANGASGTSGGRRGKSSLPSTGKGFWPGLITDTPQSAAEILDAAVKALGISPSREDMKKLMQRQTNALHLLVKSKAIGDSGSGRERRFFRIH